MLIKLKQDNDILKNDKEYFFTFLTDRFEYATILWQKALEKYFQKKFEPIFVIQAKLNAYFSHKNFALLNERLIRIQKDTGYKNFIFFSESEDINQEFSDSKSLQNLIAKLLKKQNRLFVLPFSTTNLLFSSSKIFILGPDSKIAAKYDNKIEHKLLFDKLDLPRNKSEVFETLEDAKKKIKRFPVFLSAAFSSGGHESRIIYTPQQIEMFFHGLRKVNRHNKFLAAPFIEDVMLSPNSNAIVIGENQTVVNCVSDQILRAQAYLGNVYPSKTTPQQKEIIVKTTEKVGNYLSNKDFRGIFGLDFIIDKKGKIYVTDLNPRKQGGYLCHILAAHQKKIDLIDLELKTYLKKKVLPLKYSDFQVDFVWAHSKIKPYRSGQKIIRNFCFNEPFTPFEKKGETYKAVFYPKNYIFVGGSAGYYITTGTNRDQVLEKLKKDVSNIISSCFKFTSWGDYFDNPRTFDLIQ